MHCGVEGLLCPITASVTVDLVFEIPFLLKFLFLTVFSKIYCPTKEDVLGTWEVIILFINSWRFFGCFIPGYPKVTVMSLKC